MIAMEFLELGRDLPNDVNVLVEIPKDSRLKIEIDSHHTGIAIVAKILPSGVVYQGNMTHAYVCKHVPT